MVYAIRESSIENNMHAGVFVIALQQRTKYVKTRACFQHRMLREACRLYSHPVKAV